MTKRKKVLLIVLSISALAICISTLWFLFPEWSYINSDIEKVYCKATLDDNFAEDTILILLTHEASLESVYYDYTPADFAEIGCVEVSDLSSGITEDIRTGEETDTATYRRILSLKLKYPSKLNVLLAIKILEHRSDIYCAEPNYIFHVDFP